MTTLGMNFIPGIYPIGYTKTIDVSELRRRGLDNHIHLMYPVWDIHHKPAIDDVYLAVPIKRPTHFLTPPRRLIPVFNPKRPNQIMSFNIIATTGYTTVSGDEIDHYTERVQERKQGYTLTPSGAFRVPYIEQYMMPLERYMTESIPISKSGYSRDLLVTAQELDAIRAIFEQHLGNFTEWAGPWEGREGDLELIMSTLREYHDKAKSMIMSENALETQVVTDAVHRIKKNTFRVSTRAV